MDSHSLNSQLESMVDELVESGRFASREEVLIEGVRLLGERERLLAGLDERLARGLADVKTGRSEDADIVFERLIAKYEAKGAAEASARPTG